MNPMLALRQYQKVNGAAQTSEASPHRLVQMLMEGGLERIAQARGAIERKDIPAKCTAISKAVGIIGPFSGPFAHYGALFKAGAEGYVATQGGKLAGKSIEFIYRDTGGPNPGQTKTLVQELIVKDKVDYLGGFVFTPNAFAVAPLIQQSRTPTVIFNAATSAITCASPAASGALPRHRLRTSAARNSPARASLLVPVRSTTPRRAPQMQRLAHCTLLTGRHCAGRLRQVH